ncbi:MAG: ATP-grasp domain-containing protein [Lautropia sp.]
MRLIEADAKKMLWRRGINVPPAAELLEPDTPPPARSTPVAVKAQVLRGDRAGDGLVELVDAGDAGGAIERVRERLRAVDAEPLILLEQRVPFRAEYYAAWRIDDLSQQPMLLFSRSGGSGIEARAGEVGTYLHPVLEELEPYRLASFLRQQQVPSEHLGPIARFCAALYQAFRHEDALLIEINPLVVDDRGVVTALDAKVALDESAAPRHPDWPSLRSAALQASDATPLELAGKRAGFTFVELPGRIAVYSAGAGLGMCLIDVLAHAGLPAANFCDATGGAGSEKWAAIARVVLERARQPDVDAALVFLVLTATSVKSVVEGLLQVLDAAPLAKPIVVGLVCAGAAEKDMTFEAAREVFGERGLHCVNDLRDAVRLLGEALGTADAAVRV